MDYTIEYRQVGSEDVTTVTGITNTYYDVSSLSAGVEYEFRLREEYAEGPSQWTNWVSWTNTYLYNVQYQEVNNPATVQTVSGVGDTFLDVTGLNSNTDYEFRVQADTTQALSSWSDWTSFTTEFAGPTLDAVTFPDGVDYAGSIQVNAASSSQYQHTTSAWVKWNGSDAFGVWDTKNDIVSDSGGNIIILADGKVRYYGFDGQSNGWIAQVTSTTSIPANEWVHICVAIRRNDKRQFYFNGVSQNTTIGRFRDSTYNEGLNLADDFYCGSINGSSLGERTIAQLFYDDKFYDLDNSVTLQKFYNNGAVDMGSDGTASGLDKPLIYHNGDAQAFKTNNGRTSTDGGTYLDYTFVDNGGTATSAQGPAISQDGVTKDAAADLTSSFTSTVDVNVIKNSQATLSSNFSTNATVDVIRSLEADLFTEFEQTTNVQRVREASATTNTSFTVNAASERLRSTTTDFSNEFTVSVDSEKLIGITADLVSEFSQQVINTRIRETEVSFTGVFVPVIIVNAQRTAETLVLSEFTIVTELSVTRSAEALLEFFADLDAQADRIREVSVNLSSESFASVDPSSDLQLDATLSCVTNINVEATKFKSPNSTNFNTTATLSCDANAVYDPSETLESAFTVDVKPVNELIILDPLVASSNFNVDVEPNVIVDAVVDVNAEFTSDVDGTHVKGLSSDLLLTSSVSATLSQIYQASATLSSIFNLTADGKFVITDRIVHTIPPEDRTFTVLNEDRTYQIIFEDRTHTIQGID